MLVRYCLLCQVERLLVWELVCMSESMGSVLVPGATVFGSELVGLPALSSAQADDLVYESSSSRVWVSRMTVADGMAFDHAVTVERLGPVGWVSEGTLEMDPAVVELFVQPDGGIYVVEGAEF